MYHGSLLCCYCNCFVLQFFPEWVNITYIHSWFNFFFDSLFCFCLFFFSAQSNAAIVDSLRRLLENSELGPVLDEIPYTHIACISYLMDFAHIVYKPSVPSVTKEHEVCSREFSFLKTAGFPGRTVFLRVIEINF